MKLALGSDHGGFHLKEHLKTYLQAKGIEVLDCGTHSEDSCDYPDISKAVCDEIAKGTVTQAIIICGTGLGVAIAANKCKGIRAVTCGDAFSVRMSREHNDANVLCLGERVIGKGLAELLVDEWLKTEFAGGRHQRRVDKIMELEQ